MQKMDSIKHKSETEEPHVLVYKRQMQETILTFSIRSGRKQRSSHFTVHVLISFPTVLGIKPRPCTS